MRQVGDIPGLTIVADEQFEAFLGLLDNPPTVPDALRREIMNRRWT